MSNKQPFFDIMHKAIDELNSEISRAALLTHVVYFSSRHKTNVMMQAYWYANKGERAKAQELLDGLGLAEEIEQGCGDIIRSKFSELNKMAFLAHFSIVEACLEDAFNFLIKNNGGKEMLIEKGILSKKWMNKEVEDERLYDLARKQVSEGHAEFHSKLCECLSVSLIMYGNWSSELNEMKEIRNCFLHRANKVDSKLEQIGSRWVGKGGEEIILDMVVFKELMMALALFLKDLFYGFASEDEKEILDQQGFWA